MQESSALALSHTAEGRNACRVRSLSRMLCFKLRKDAMPVTGVRSLLRMPYFFSPAPGMRGMEWRYGNLAKAKVTTSGLRWVAVLWLLRSHTVRTTVLSVPGSVSYSRSQQHVHDNIDDDNKARGGTQ